MRKLFLQLALAFLGFSHADAAPLNDWPFRQGLEVTAPGLVRVALPPETFDAAQASLADLRLIDPAGLEVPYLVERPRAVTRMLRPQEGWQVFLEANRTRIEIDVKLRGRLVTLGLESPATEFLKAVSLSGTASGTTLTLLTSHPIFRQAGGATQLQLQLPEGAWTHFTLLIDDTRSKPIPITGVQLQEEESPAPTLETASARLGERIESAGETRLTFDLGAARVPLGGLRIQTDEPLFVRRVNILTRQWENGEVRERSLGGGTIYRVAVEGQATSSRLDLSLDVQPPTRELTLVIDNGDSPPLPVSAITALLRPTRLVFLARQAGAFQMFSGNPRVAAPRYDVAALAAQLKSASIIQLKAGALVANSDYQPSEPLPEIPLFAAALDTAPWAFRRAIKAASGSVQQLELTPHVLAHAQAGFSDLRLVAAGKQVPFIVERAVFSRAITPEVLRADDPKQPRLSRWNIHLPQARLPIAQLSCETKASLFQREARVSEWIVDGRGERYPRQLGTASWMRKPDAKSGRFSVTLSSAPQTQTLQLEIDNGDNPPLELERFKVYLPVTRLLFKAPPGATVELCYGNPKAVAPSYDLGLVAPQILAAAKSEATLTDADPTGLVRQGSSGTTTSRVFIGVLALVVVVLILVIVRLLPKPANPA
jgi:Protein of unknown function (DUF3999)